MIEFLDDYFDNIKIFTNVEFIKLKYNNDYFEFIDDCNLSDISIVDYNYKIEGNSNVKINIDKYDSNTDAFIDRDFIIAYLDLLKKFDSNVCGISMADITDVITATKGILIEHINFKLNSNIKLEDIERFKKKLKGGNFKGSIILFLCINDYLIMDKIIKEIEELYINTEIVILKPIIEEIKEGNYIEVFVFKGEE